MDVEQSNGDLQRQQKVLSAGRAKGLFARQWWWKNKKQASWGCAAVSRDARSAAVFNSQRS